ncbi:hypothetical protein A0J61_10858, partial [Choanephora cucurbitarum]
VTVRPISALPSCLITPDVLLTIALSELWKTHWAHVHQRSPFLVEPVFKQTLWTFKRRAAEEFSSFK